jgi:vacuolar-type H+-ATPase subunit E/Vma4
MSEISKFTEDILRSAREKAESILREAETETQRVSDEAKATISREVEGIVRRARADAEAVKRRQISEARHRTKLREQEEKERIMRDVLDRVHKGTSQLVAEETKYVPLLTHLIESGISELGDKSAMIHLSKTDLERNSSSLEQRINKSLLGRVKVEWSKEPIDATGGAVISSLDGKIRIVNTLDQKFEALEPRMLIEARASLFGE